MEIFRTAADFLGELRSRGLLPDDAIAVHVSGSIVRGWGNQSSDLDVYVICLGAAPIAGASPAPVALNPNMIAMRVPYVDGRPWEVEYWLDEQVDQMFAKISWAEFDRNRTAGSLITSLEMAFLCHLAHAVPVQGDEWLAGRRAQLDGSALRSILLVRHLDRIEGYLDDARGQLAGADTESAVLSARLAFGAAIDTLLVSHGEFNQSPKWRARCLRLVAPPEMTFEDYWAIETMAGYDPADPRGWINEVIRTCQRISLGVNL